MAHSAVARVLSESSARSLQRVANRGSRRKPYSIGSGRRALTTFGASARSTAASQSHAPRWGTGLAICTSLATLYWTSSLQWHILPVALAESAPTSHAELDESFVHLDPDTKMAFPSTLSSPSTSAPLQLVGLGVRVVSFLRVQVYSVGSYFALDALKRLKGKQAVELQGGEQIVSELLDLPYDVAVRIVPVKNTDHGHLRDGFVRAMLARLKIATSAGSLNDEQAEAAAMAIETFKGFFPTGKVQRGKSMLLVRRGSDGALLLEFEGKILGTLANKFLAKQLILAYFADNGKEISPKMKTDVLAGLQRYL